MRPTRRELLAGVTGAAACGSPSGRSYAPGPIGPGLPGITVDPSIPGLLDEASFPGGLRAGDPTSDGFVVSVRTALPEVTLLVARQTASGWLELPPLTGLVPENGTLSVDVGGLEPATEHRFVVASSDGRIHSAVAVYRTLAAAGTSPTVVFGATTCLGFANPTLPGLLAAAGEGLDLFVLAGDTIYTEAESEERYHAQYDVLLAKESVRALGETTPLVAVWDDHEVRNNWTVGPPRSWENRIEAEHLAIAAAAFREALPQRLGPAGSRFWRRLTIGDTVELFLLDCRGERTALQMISELQLAWLIEGLWSSPCLFKIVVTSVHVTDHADRMSVPGEVDDVYDRWQGYPKQRAELLAAAAVVPGVAFLSGDMHYGGIQEVGAKGDPGHGLVEVAAGPTGSAWWPVREWLEAQGGDMTQYLDLVETWSWARFVADPTERTLSVELIGDDGQVRASREIARVA